MNSDVAFHIGSTHDICQDYALSLNNSIVLSDGCSDSPLSDLGARLMCVSALSLGSNNKDIDPLNYVYVARSSLKILNLPSKCLNATLLTAIPNTGEVSVIGDGVVVVKLKTGNYFLAEVDYDGENRSLPFYPNYFAEPEILREWCQEVVIKTSASEFMVENGVWVNKWSESYDSKPNNPFAGLYDHDNSANVSAWFDGDNLKFFVMYLESQVEWVALMSDGVKTFYKRNEDGSNEAIPLTSVLPDLLNFKNYSGKFVQRRMNRFVKDCEKKGWNHADDISLAVLCFGD